MPAVLAAERLHTKCVSRPLMGCAYTVVVLLGECEWVWMAAT